MKPHKIPSWTCSAFFSTPICQLDVRNDRVFCLHPHVSVAEARSRLKSRHFGCIEAESVTGRPSFWFNLNLII